jgi:hypothetical protein
MLRTARFPKVTLAIALSTACASPPAPVSPTSPARAAQEMPEPAASPAEKPAATSGVLFVGCGFLFVDNEGNVPYSVFFAGEDVKHVPHESEIAIVLDGVLIEVNTTTSEELGAPGARGMVLLEAHKTWETEHIRKAKGWAELKGAAGGRLDFGRSDFEAMMWGLDLPSEVEVLSQRINRLAFITAAIDNAVLVLTVPLRPDDDLRIPAAKTGAAIRSLKLLAQPLDVNEVAEQLKASNEPWTGCSEGE